MAFILDWQAGALDLGIVGGLGWICMVESPWEIRGPLCVNRSHNVEVHIFWRSDEFNTQMCLLSYCVLNLIELFME